MNNIKRIIFDLDNTLIMWKDEYLEGLKNTLETYHIEYDYKKLNDVVDTEYENVYSSYTKKYLQKFIKNRLNIDLSLEFINTWQKSLSTMSEENTEVSEVLSYLNKKYELVVLTNWFKEPQKKRIEHAKMDGYFKEIYGGDNHIKPNVEAFLEAVGPYKPEECLMIGDSYEIDILGALNAGLKAIHLSKKEPISGITTIKNIEELKEIL